MRIIGIDPGLRVTGWGIIEFNGNILRHVSNGSCKSSISDDLAFRLLDIYEQLEKVICDYSPDFSAVESTFVNKDAVASLKLGHARGVAMLAPAKAGLMVFEYAPNVIKKAVVGVGHADKNQVKQMIKLQLPGTKIDGSDASDALAVALCHAYHSRTSQRFTKAVADAEAKR